MYFLYLFITKTVLTGRTVTVKVPGSTVSVATVPEMCGLMLPTEVKFSTCTSLNTWEFLGRLFVCRESRAVVQIFQSQKGMVDVSSDLIICSKARQVLLDGPFYHKSFGVVDAFRTASQGSSSYPLHQHSTSLVSEARSWLVVYITACVIHRPVRVSYLGISRSQLKI